MVKVIKKIGLSPDDFEHRIGGTTGFRKGFPKVKKKEFKERMQKFKSKSNDFATQWDVGGYKVRLTDDKAPGGKFCSLYVLNNPTTPY